MQSASRVGGARVSAYRLQLTPDVTNRSLLNDVARPGPPAGGAVRAHMTKPMVRSAMRSGTTTQGSAHHRVESSERRHGTEPLTCCTRSSIVMCAARVGARRYGETRVHVAAARRVHSRGKPSSLGREPPVRPRERRWALGRACCECGVRFWNSPRRSATDGFDATPLCGTTRAGCSGDGVAAQSAWAAVGGLGGVGWASCDRSRRVGSRRRLGLVPRKESRKSGDVALASGPAAEARRLASPSARCVGLGIQPGCTAQAQNGRGALRW
jgi:hypothetical protein